MKSTGIVRKLDPLGRITLPKELRGEMGIELKDPLEIYVDCDVIILKRYAPLCVFCGSSEDVVAFCHKKACRKCSESLCESFLPLVNRQL